MSEFNLPSSHASPFTQNASRVYPQFTQFQAAISSSVRTHPALDPSDQISSPSLDSSLAGSS